MAVLAGAELLFGRDPLHREVLDEPLLHEHAKRGGRQADDEACAPKPVDAERPEGSFEDRVGRNSCRRTRNAAILGVALHEDLAQEEDDLVVWAGLKACIAADDECSDYGRKKSSLFMQHD